MEAHGANQTVIVVTGGDPVALAHLGAVPEAAVVIAADSGIDAAHALGLRVDIAVGDFDSVSPDALQRVIDDGATVRRHPEAKDATDLELALDAALALRPARVLVVGGHGGRLDHFLANALLLAATAYEGVELVAQMGPARVTVVRTSAQLTGAAGDLVTLLAVNGPAVGVTTDGLIYPLRDEDLPPGGTRGVSNELVADRAAVRLRGGVLIAVQPGLPGTHQRRTSP